MILGTGDTNPANTRHTEHTMKHTELGSLDVFRIGMGAMPINALYTGTKSPEDLLDNAGAADEPASADLTELDALPVPTGGRHF
ncbi:hypothetical protein ACIRD9_25160 [Streptomyces violaceus]|uniref:hypothetical protein n=1 Tax=Streptomyces violaceus TaxID=1936 RepID=UPI0038122064